MTSRPVPYEVRQTLVDLMNSYAHALDTCDWTLLKSLFTEDAVLTASILTDRREPDEVGARLEGRDVLIGTIRDIWKGLSGTHHLFSNYVVNLAPDGASAKTSCYLRAHHAGAGAWEHVFEESLGRFDFEMVRDGSVWLIRRMHESVMVMLGNLDVIMPNRPAHP